MVPLLKVQSVGSPTGECDATWAFGLLESSPDGFAQYDLAKNIVFANLRFCTLWHLDHRNLPGMSQTELNCHKFDMLSDPLKDAHLLDIEPGLQEGLEPRYIKLKDGMWYERTVYDHMVDGQCVGHVVQWRDVTRKHTAMVLLQHERDLLHAMMDSVPDQIYFKDTKSNFTRVNKALGMRYGLTNPQEAIGRSDADFYSAEHAAQTRREELEIMSTRRPVINQLHHEIWADGNDAWNLSSKMPLVDTNGEVIGIYGTARDITDQKRSETVIWRQANFDALTNLPNRRLMRDRWDQAMNSHKRSGDILALVLIDLDHFKEVNDTKGHAIGDILLVQASERMLACLRDTDTLARLGGDEFALILTAFSNVGAIETLARGIVQCLNAGFELSGHSVLISCSLGISLYPAHGESFDELLQRADQAMYSVKRSGGDGFAIFGALP